MGSEGIAGGLGSGLLGDNSRDRTGDMLSTHFTPGAAIPMSSSQFHQLQSVQQQLGALQAQRIDIMEIQANSGTFIPTPLSDFIFKGQDDISKKTALKRIEEYRKKYPNESDCLEKMYNKAYKK